MHTLEDVPTTQARILDVLSEGRATPAFVLERVEDLDSQQQTDYHLRQLRAKGHVEKVHRGLYALSRHEDQLRLTEVGDGA